MSTIEQCTAIGQALVERNLKLVTAESCTGGGVAYALTEIAGSSQWFERGMVTYSNEAKEALLGVQGKTLETFGAVSRETAQEMAEGCLTWHPAQVSVAITGIAGPSGGTAQKPVGTVWFAWAREGMETQVELHNFSGDRHSIRIQAIETALTTLLKLLTS